MKKKEPLNMKKSSLIISALLIFLTLGDMLSAGRGKQHSEEWSLLNFARKCLSCCLRKKVLEEDEERAEPLLKEYCFSFTNISHGKSEIEKMDLELLQIVFKYLPPENINLLSISSKSLKMKIGPEFWEDYLIEHKQERGSRSIPAVKVACAYSFFNQRKIKKAGKLGLRKAIQILEYRKRQKETEAKKKEHQLSKEKVNQEIIYRNTYGLHEGYNGYYAAMFKDLISKTPSHRDDLKQF